MNNLQLLHCDKGQFLSPGNTTDTKKQECQFIAIDTLTPAIYLLCDRSRLIGFDHNRNVNLRVDLDAQGNGIFQRSDTSMIVGFDFLADLQQICLCTSAGNIFTFDPLHGQSADQVVCLANSITTTGWSPDYEILIAITADNSILMINRDFLVINEMELNPPGFGTDDLITVGWGKKETQFHGSVGKQAAFARSTLESTPVLEWDDGKTRISWREDGQYFSVNSVDPSKGRTIRVWSREGGHCSTNERVEGAGQCLAWKPSGSLIATSQNSKSQEDGSCQVIFFERNGLRHGEFVLQASAGCQVQELAWNRESTILAAWSRLADGTSYLQLLTTSNYHWYCKLSYSFPADAGPSALCWDPDQANTLHVALQDGTLISFLFAFVIHRYLTSDRALITVIDGKQLLITDFGQVVIPPPMCQNKISISSFTNEISYRSNDDRGGEIVCLTDMGRVIIIDLGSSGGVMGPNSLKPSIRNTTEAGLKIPSSESVIYHFTHLRPAGLFAFVVSSSSSRENGQRWILVIIQLSSADSDHFTVKKSIEMINGVYQLVPLLHDHSSTSASGHPLAILELADGSFCCLDDQLEIVPAPFLINKSLPSVAWQVEPVVMANGGEKVYVVCLNDRFQLTINGDEVSNDVTSICVHECFLLFTTITHHLKCLPLELLQNGYSANRNLASAVIDARNIERGAKLVAAVASEGKVILQMPRGNLETIYPRALVLSIVKSMLDKFQYKEALLLMRRHRINLNLLYDHSPKDFLKNITDFVDQINDSTLLNLFISDLKNEDVSESMYSKFYPSRCGASMTTTKKEGLVKMEAANNTNNKVNEVCEHLRTALLTRAQSELKYCTSILTALVKMNPPKLDDALRVVKDFRDSGLDSKIIDEALQHLLYYVDANRLFDVALGTYDFDLVLMAAEKSQKDPKEFLPFLEELRLFEPAYKKYKIDAHLGRLEKALEHLWEYAKSDYSTKFDEFLNFVNEHKFHGRALKLLPEGSEEYQKVCLALGDQLVSQRKYEEAALSYQIGRDVGKAVENYAKALNWKMALGLACKTDIERDKLTELCETLSRKLKDQRCFKDAANIELEFLKDAGRCVGTLLEGGHWEEAVFRIYQHGALDLIESMLIPALKSSVQKTLESIQKHQATFGKYKTRLGDVRAGKKLRLKEINEKREIGDAASEMSTETGSTTTRSSTSSMRSTSSRAKRTKKQERKKYSVKEGNPYEDLGLLKELKEIVGQVEKMQDEVSGLLRIIGQFGRREEGETLQRAFGEFRADVRSSIGTIWPDAIDLALLPGPIEDQLTTGDSSSTAEDVIDRLCTIADSRLKIKLDENMIPPKINPDTNDFGSAFSLFSS